MRHPPTPLRLRQLLANIPLAPPRRLRSSLDRMRQPLGNHIHTLDPRCLRLSIDINAGLVVCVYERADFLVAVGLRQAEEDGALDVVGVEGEELGVGEVRVRDLGAGFSLSGFFLLLEAGWLFFGLFGVFGIGAGGRCSVR